MREDGEGIRRGARRGRMEGEGRGGKGNEKEKRV